MEALSIQQQQKYQFSNNNTNSSPEFYSNSRSTTTTTTTANSKQEKYRHNHPNENNPHSVVFVDYEMQKQQLKNNSIAIASAVSNNTKNTNKENLLKKSKKYFKFLQKQQQQQQQQQLYINQQQKNRNQQSYEQINNFFLPIQQKQHHQLSNNQQPQENLIQFNPNNELQIKQQFHSNSESSANNNTTLRNFQTRVRSSYKLFKEKLKSSSGSIEYSLPTPAVSSSIQQQQFCSNSSILFENNNNSKMYQQQLQFTPKNNTKNPSINNNNKININSASTTNTSTAALTGLCQIDDNNNNNNNNSSSNNNNMRIYFNEELNYPFVVHDNEIKHRKRSVSPANNRNKSSSSLERKLNSNEKYLQINALVNNKGINDHQQAFQQLNIQQQQQQQQQQMFNNNRNNFHASPYFYRDQQQQPPPIHITAITPPTIPHNGKSRGGKPLGKQNIKDDIFVNGTFISGKQYYQHVGKNANILDILNNDNIQETQELVQRFNTLNIPSMESASTTIKQQQSHNVSTPHLNTVYAQPFDDFSSNNDLNTSAFSTATASGSGNKASKQLNKLLKQIKRKLKQSSKVEKFNTSLNTSYQQQQQQQQTSVEQNLIITNNLNPNDVSTASANSASYSKQSNISLDTSLPAQPQPDNSKKQNRDIITKLYKAYNKKFNKSTIGSAHSNNSNSTTTSTTNLKPAIKQFKNHKIPSTLVTEIFAVDLEKQSTAANDTQNHQYPHINEIENENIRKRIKSYRSDPNLTFPDSSVYDPNRYNSEMNLLLKQTKEKFGPDLQISTKTIENNNYLSAKLHEIQARIKSTDNLENKFRLNDFLISQQQLQQGTPMATPIYNSKQHQPNESSQAYSKFPLKTSISTESKPQRIPKQPLFLQKHEEEFAEVEQLNESAIEPSTQAVVNITRSKSFTSNLTLTPSSKKRVSFHEQVIKTDVESGSSTLVPILYNIKERHPAYTNRKHRSMINEKEAANESAGFQLNNRTPAETPLQRNFYELGSTINENGTTFLAHPEIIYPKAAVENANRNYEIINFSNRSLIQNDGTANVYQNSYSAYDRHQQQQQQQPKKPIEQHF